MKKLLSILFATFVFINISSAQPPPPTKTLKFLIRLDGVDSTKYDLFVQIKTNTLSGASATFATIKMSGKTLTAVATDNNFVNVPHFNTLMEVIIPLDLNEIPKIKVKLRDKSTDKDESNVARFKDIKVVSPTEVPNYIYCISVESINGEANIYSSSENDDNKFTGGKGSTIVISAGMP
jgi:hypothetical protein